MKMVIIDFPCEIMFYVDLQLSRKVFNFLIVESPIRREKHIASTHTFFIREARFHMGLQLSTRNWVIFDCWVQISCYCSKK